MDTLDEDVKDPLKFAQPLTEHYLKMTPSQIAEKLSKRKLPPMVESDTLEAYRREKQKLNKANAKARQYSRLWREFTMPLKAEIKTVKVMLNNYMGDERHEALSWYLTVLEEQHTKMMRFAVGENTPSKVAKGAASILNDGTHWTDWVPMSKRAEVYTKFAAIPKGNRTKVPFERRIPKTLGIKLRDRLLLRTQREMESTKRQLKILRMTNVEFERIDSLENDLKRMTLAIEWIKDMKDMDSVPTTWHGFFKSGAFKTKATSKQAENDDEA
jgi:hypothetical protein